MPKPFIRTRVHHEVLDSTSDEARRLAARGGVALPLLVTAGRQTRGRGRGDNSWWSDGGSLTFTIALDPSVHGLRPEHEPRVALACAIAVIDAIAPLLSEDVLGIRWPNDIEARGRKLGGLLPERIETPEGSRMAIGIGLNVLSTIADAPPSIRPMAIALADLTRIPPSPDDLLERILGRLEPTIAQLSQDDPALPARWEALDTLKGQRVRVDLETRLVEGIGHAIDAEGALLVETGKTLHRLFGGRVLRDLSGHGE